jgi:hypothetical protein
MSKKYKKLSLQYSYLKLEFEEVKETCEKSENELRQYMKTNHPDEYNKFYGINNKKQDEQVHNLDPEIDENIEDVEKQSTDSIPKNKDLKILYRKIAEKTHPDKTGNNDLSGIFSKAAEAYKNNNLGLLLEIGSGLNIEITTLSPESLALLEENIKHISDDVFHQQQTTSWSWSLCETEEQKKALIQKLLNYINQTAQEETVH